MVHCLLPCCRFVRCKCRVKKLRHEVEVASKLQLPICNSSFDPGPGTGWTALASMTGWDGLGLGIWRGRSSPPPPPIEVPTSKKEHHVIREWRCHLSSPQCSPSGLCLVPGHWTHWTLDWPPRPHLHHPVTIHRAGQLNTHRPCALPALELAL